MGGSQRRHGMAHGAVGEHHGSWRADKCRNTQGRVDGASSYQERRLRLALPSAGSAVGGRLDRHRADSRRAVAPAERGPARALGASKRRKPREWARSGVQPQRFAPRLARGYLFFSEIHGSFMGMERFLASFRPAQYDENSDGCHGTTQNRPRSSWYVTHTGTQTITWLRRLLLNLPLRLSAWHTTRARRDPRRAP